METFIIPTSSAEHLAKKIKAKKAGLKIVFPGKNREGKRFFPDGEVYVEITKAGNLKKKRVLVLHSGLPKPNQGLVELELILQILKDNKIKPELFFSYFPYGQQDKAFEKGELNVAESLTKKFIGYYKVKKIYIIDPHFGERSWLKKYPVISLSAIPCLIKKARQDFAKDILFLSPDKGGKRRTGFSGIKKERINSFRVKYFSPKMSLKNKTVGVLDDIIETGGTLLRFHEVVRKSGAEKIIVLATHGALASGISKIKKSYSKLYLTNTINQKQANIDITDLILKTIS